MKTIPYLQVTQPRFDCDTTTRTRFEEAENNLFWDPGVVEG